MEINDSITKSTRIWLITGDPGSGKTTIVSKIILKAKTNAFTVGGVLTREVRSHGERVGFKLFDISSEETGTLAAIEHQPGPRVGRYHVNLKALEGLGRRALDHASKNSDVIVCDEIGPMELISPEFRKAANENILRSEKPCLCVVHKRMADPIIDELKSDPRSKLFEATYENRDALPDEIWMEMLELLKNRPKLS